MDFNDKGSGAGRSGGGDRVSLGIFAGILVWASWYGYVINALAILEPLEIHERFAMACFAGSGILGIMTLILLFAKKRSAEKVCLAAYLVFLGGAAFWAQTWVAGFVLYMLTLLVFFLFRRKSLAVRLWLSAMIPAVVAAMLVSYVAGL